MKPTTIDAAVVRAAWLLLGDQCTPVFVAETRTGYAIGDYAYCLLARSHVELAGYFNSGVELDTFADAVNEAARDASTAERARERAARMRGRRP